jgi:O-antigen ligase
VIWPLLILAAAAALVLIQLIPLPPVIWEALPGRRVVTEGYAAAGMAAPWLPVSMTPRPTWDAFLGLVPPAAMFCATLTLGRGTRRAMAVSVLVMAALSVGLGMLQRAGGPSSPWWLYGAAEERIATGFFANQNHQAVFLAASLPLAAFLATRQAAGGGSRALFWSAAAAAFALVVVAGAAVTAARAAVALVPLGFIGSAAVVVRNRAGRGAGRWSWAPLGALAAASALAAGLVAFSGNSALAQRLEEKFGADLRVELFPTVAKAGLVFAPVGAGVGSFPVVYQMFERPQTLGPAFINHAHDEYLETWMESGVAGVALIVAFVGWWVSASWAILREARRSDAGLALAGSAIVGILLIHSLVDYPLRTPAVAVLFAMACGLMLPVVGEGERPRKREGSGGWRKTEGANSC